jgi:predicted nuclease of predicted toxin-antitoxin system
LTQFIADENIPKETVDLLKKQGVDIISVTKFAYGLSDTEVLDLANKNGRIVITFDKGFGQLIFKEKRKTKGLILLRFTPKSPQQIAKRIQQVLATNIRMENSVVTVKKDSIRVQNRHRKVCILDS